MTTAYEFTFGIEIECRVPRNLGVSRGGYHDSHTGYFTNPETGREERFLPEGWNSTSDSTIAESREFVGVEFVSPILRGAEGLREVKRVYEILNRYGCRPHKSAGLHIHVGFDKTNRKVLTRLVNTVANAEKAIFASTGTHRRESANWGGSLKRFASNAREVFRARNRYASLNITTRHPTVEFRAFASTMNFAKVCAYIRMVVGMVERSFVAGRSPSWTPKTIGEGSPMKRRGLGCTEVCRLFYTLGWTKGRTTAWGGRVFGKIVGDGLPSMKASKRAVMAMARKYDGIDGEVSETRERLATSTVTAAEAGCRTA